VGSEVVRCHGRESRGKSNVLTPQISPDRHRAHTTRRGVSTRFALLFRHVFQWPHGQPLSVDPRFRRPVSRAGTLPSGHRCAPVQIPHDVLTRPICTPPHKALAPVPPTHLAADHARVRRRVFQDEGSTCPPIHRSGSCHPGNLRSGIWIPLNPPTSSQYRIPHTGPLTLVRSCTNHSNGYRRYQGAQH
jgi:hypothetical protein